MYDENNNGIYESSPYPPNEEYNNQGKGYIGFAIASLVLSILSLILCCCWGFNLVLAIPALILGIVALVKRYKGKGMAISGIIISSVSILITGMMLVSYGPIFKDVFRTANDFENIRDTYEETGELPEYLEKYTDEKYDYIWQSEGYDDFYDFFDYVIEEVDKSNAEANNNAD